LEGAEVVGDGGEVGVVFLTEDEFEEDIFGFENGIALEFGAPVAVVVAHGDEGFFGAFEGGFEVEWEFENGGFGEGIWGGVDGRDGGISDGIVSQGAEEAVSVESCHDEWVPRGSMRRKLRLSLPSKRGKRLTEQQNTGKHEVACG
jgi:hypothetical protein